MEINITFFVQAMHFALGWIILKYWFLRPTLILIEYEKKEEKNNDEVIKKLRDTIVAQEARKKIAWKHSLFKFAEKRPNLSGLLGVYRLKDESSAKKLILDGAVIQKQAEIFTNELVNCLEHAHD